MTLILRSKSGSRQRIFSVKQRRACPHAKYSARSESSYKTAWYLCHRIRAAMIESQRSMLDGKVEMDETYVGGKRRGFGKRLGMANKETVIGIRKRNGELRFFHAKDAKSGTLAQYIRENISEDVDVIFTDEGTAYPDAMRRAGVKTHKTIQHKNRIYVQGDVHTNTVESAFSLLKRGIMGTWHKISVKHLPSYLDEMTFGSIAASGRSLLIRSSI